MDIEYKDGLFPCVVPWDPAIDFAKSDITRYQKDRDIAKLVFKPEPKPTIFYLRQLPRMFFLEVVSNSKSNMAAILFCFQWSVAKIENLRIGDDICPIWYPTHVNNCRGREMKIIDWDMLEDDAVFDSPTILDIGAVAHDRGFLAKGSKPIYALLPTSEALVTRTMNQQNSAEI